MPKYKDLSTDAGFEDLVGFMKEGSLKINGTTDLDAMLEKQAYQEEALFADPATRSFSIATPDETNISARYAEKYASELDFDTLATINEACQVFGVPMLKLAAKEPKALEFEDIFGLVSEPEPKEKVASRESYGTEFELALAARASVVPEEAENIEKIAAMKDVLEPAQMAEMLSEFDEACGLDLPWIQTKVGSVEYAVYEKRASALDINLAGKGYSIEKLAENQDLFDSHGLDVDFDEDPYAIKLALERLPVTVQKSLSRLLG